MLSVPDLHVLALTYALEVEAHGTWRIREQVGGKTGQQMHEARRLEEKARAQASGLGEPKPLANAQSPEDAAKLRTTSATPAPPAPAAAQHTPATGASDDGFTVVDAAHGFHVPDSAPAPPAAPPLDEDDEEAGEWITPDNITKHKNKALGIVTEGSVTEKRSRRRRGRKGAPAHMSVACMTSDFAVQNVLLQMGLYLVSTDGMRIERVKSWVLRCHACFKLCKDPERKFCPTCGNPTLIRTSVSSAAPGSGEAGLQVHLKPNFQYHNRGSKYSLPMPQPGSASGGRPSGSARNSKTGVPILREDQAEWQRAVSRQRIHKQREERALNKALERGQDSLSVRYADPDWLPDLLTGNHTRATDDLPALGIGRKNPNERRRRRK